MAKVKPRTKAAKRAKARKVFDEFGAGKLRSGSKTGPVVTNPKQAQAIAMSESGQRKKKGRKKGRRSSR